MLEKLITELGALCMLNVTFKKANNFTSTTAATLMSSRKETTSSGLSVSEK